MEANSAGADEKRPAAQAPMVMMAVEHYAHYRWVQAVTGALCAWLIVSPFIFGTRSAELFWSEIVSGALGLVMAVVARKPRRGLISWLISLVGVWVLFAPLAFPSPNFVVYAQDTLIGALLISFGLIVPMAMSMEGPATPRGWSYNPSTWSQRAPVIALSFVGFLAASYMACFQLGYIDAAWDPFFGDGTRRVLTSRVSGALPVSDAGLGAMIYLLEFLMGLMGDKRRWRTMPWMVGGFGIIVVPLGIVSIALVILQPLVVHAWCFWCLFTAAAMLLMIPLTLDEVVAMLQAVRDQKRAGSSAWRVFWLGASSSKDARDSASRADRRPRSMLRGVSSSWNLWLCTAIGIWLMFAPSVFGIGNGASAADSDHLVGALVVVVSVISFAEVARPVRFVNALLGIWLMLSPFVLHGATSSSLVNSAILGLVTLLFSLPRGPVRDRYGAYDRVARFSLAPARSGAHRDEQAQAH